MNSPFSPWRRVMSAVVAFLVLWPGVGRLPAQDDGREVYRGKVLLERDGRRVPFPEGRVGATNEAGRMTESAEIERDGSYALRLTPGTRSTIQVLVRGYAFEPARVIFFASGGREIPTFVARALPTGTVVGTMRPDPRSAQSVSVANQRFLVRDAGNGQLLSTLIPDGRKKFRYSDYEGREIVVEPQANAGVAWTPASQRIVLGRGNREVVFDYMPAGEVGTGNLNLAKDRVEIPDVVRPKLSLRIVNGNEILTGSEIELSVPSVEGARRTSDMRYTFLYRHDNEGNWRTAGNSLRQPKARFRVGQAGGFECRVVVLMQGAPVGKADLRAFAKDTETPAGTVKLVGKPRVPEAGDFGTVGPFPNPEFVRVNGVIDRAEGPVNVAREVSAHLELKPDRATARPTTRDGRKISFYERHESQTGWTRVAENVRSLTWRWTPSRAGRWQLRVDVWSKPEEEEHGGHRVIARDEIGFVAGASESGIATQTSAMVVAPTPTPEAGRPFVPIGKPVQQATPAATPRQGYFPPARVRATPQPSPTPGARPKGFFRKAGES